MVYTAYLKNEVIGKLRILCENETSPDTWDSHVLWGPITGKGWLKSRFDNPERYLSDLHFILDESNIVTNMLELYDC